MDEKKKCKKCKAKKILEVEKKIDVSIEAGCPTDHVIKFNGGGNELPGAEAGDLLIKVSVRKHKVYTRSGADLILEKEITLKQALLGFSFALKGLDGKEFTVSSIPGEVVQHGAIKSVKGKGLPFYRDPMSHGNLIVKFTVKSPRGSDLTDDIKAALDKVAFRNDRCSLAPRLLRPPRDRRSS